MVPRRADLLYCSLWQARDGSAAVSASVLLKSGRVQERPLEVEQLKTYAIHLYNGMVNHNGLSGFKLTGIRYLNLFFQLALKQ
jgi:hypothetical protein